MFSLAKVSALPIAILVKVLVFDSARVRTTAHPASEQALEPLHNRYDATLQKLPMISHSQTVFKPELKEQEVKTTKSDGTFLRFLMPGVEEEAEGMEE